MKRSKVKIAFERQCINLPLERILPLKTVTSERRASAKYRQIESSIREIGVIEPLVVYPEKGAGKNYILLDGVLRHDVLKAMGQDQAFCLVATEDETYTYNRKINRLTPLQQHFMILRAVESGVSEERIAATLNVDVANIRLKMDLLKGICPEAVELLKDCKAHAKTFQALRKVKPMRQIEMAELMVASNNYTGSYAECLLAATPQNKLVNITKPKEVNGLSAEEMDRMEREMDALSEDFKLIEEAHGNNVLNLTLALSYVRKLLNNAAVVRYLSKHHPDILAEFQTLSDSSLNGST